MTKPFNILLVDDNKELGENIRDILEINGYAAERVSLGSDALLSAQNKHFDLALVDIELPDIKGTELVGKLASISPSTQYIYITGHATLDSTIEAIKQKDVISYEVKPLDIDRMLLTIQQAKIRIQTETELHKSEERYRRLIEGLQDNYFFFTRDASGVFTYISPSIKNILGYTPEEFYTRYREYLTDHLVNNDAAQCLARSVKGIKQPPYEIEMYHKNGATRTLQMQEAPVFDSSKNVISIEALPETLPR